MRFPSVFLCLSLLAACKREPSPPRAPLVVEVTRVTSGGASTTFESTGEIRARVESPLSFRLSGKVVERRFDVGDHVPAGALIARLDSDQQRADVEVADAVVQSARAGLQQAELDLARETSLYQQQATSKASFDAANENVLYAKSTLASALANLSIARETLSYTELRTSRAGVITRRDVEVGQVVTFGTPAFEFAAEGPRDAVFFVDEAIARRLDKQALALRLVGQPNVTAQGTVREIAPVVDTSNASVGVKVTIEDPPHAMELRAPVVATFTLTAAKDVALPAAAMFSDAKGAPAVWVVDPKTSTVTLRPVSVTAYESRSIIIGAGLANGDLVVTRGANRLRPSQHIAYANEVRS